MQLYSRMGVLLCVDVNAAVLHQSCCSQAYRAQPLYVTERSGVCVVFCDEPDDAERGALLDDWLIASRALPM